MYGDGANADVHDAFVPPKQLWNRFASVTLAESRGEMSYENARFPTYLADNERNQRERRCRTSKDLTYHAMPFIQ